jgi:hypothetical protein
MNHLIHFNEDTTDHLRWFFKNVSKKQIDTSHSFKYHSGTFPPVQRWSKA